MPDTENRLRQAYERYDAALPHGDRQELVTSRLALCLALLESGWLPPDAVQEQITRDEKTLRRLHDADPVHTIDLSTGPDEPWRELRWLTSPAFTV